MKVGFIGLGTMGAPMARNLVQAGFGVTVHNRTRSREEPLAKAGAQRAASPAEAAAGADVVVTIVSDTPDVEEVLLGPGGVIEGAPEGCVVVDMSTISPEATRAYGLKLSEHGIHLIDAPVSGGSEGAERGTLTIMAGGAADDLERVRQVLEVLGTKITLVGPLGSGQATKAVNQVVCGGFFLAVAEGIVLGVKSGLDMDRALEAIGAGVCRSWVLENRASNMLTDSYPLGFRLSLHLKDLSIALAEAARVGADLPLTALVASIEQELKVKGFGDEDMSTIAREIRGRSGLS